MLDDKENQQFDAQHDQQPSADVNPVTDATAEASVEDPVLALPEIPAAAAAAAPSAPFDAPKPPRKAGNGWKMFAAAVALVALGAGAGSATTFVMARNLVKESLPIGYNLQSSSSLQAVSQTVAEGGASVVPGIYKKVAPSTVKIDVTAKRGYLSGSGSGSGFVVDPAGYILTNYHVIDGASTISVKFVDGTTMDAKLVSGDPNKDIALIKVDPGNRTLVAVPLGDSDNVQVGELAVAIGSPFGQEFTVTAGIVSAVNRTLVEQEGSFPIAGGIQTDAAINPGNSGGPLLNANGEVIGINTLIETGDTGVRGNLGIGFAVPINTAKEILPTLMAGKKVEYAFLGISDESLTAQLARRLGVNVKEGIVVTQVSEGSPAEKAGLLNPSQLGNVISADVITEIDGKKMTSHQDLLALIQTKKPGDKVTITVLRGKEKLTLEATLGTRPADN
ncbi:MAG TPA: trypsin-like peptidase domain-containing protein [Symbiobacteriaceae bacterium]|jgi:S1-C subfamily serine protease|nr:trypsin-like peptidase domain-containing protein [Symbiobacteriaceae bacterium]